MTRVNPFADNDYWHISEIPLGWTNSQRHNAQEAMKSQLGVQSTVQPAFKATYRPITPVRYITDEETGVKSIDDSPPPTATEWLFSGDLTGVTRAAVVDVIAVALNVNPIAVDAKIHIDEYDQDGILAFLAANPGWDGA
jgi:hypothetical protein